LSNQLQALKEKVEGASKVAEQTAGMVNAVFSKVPELTAHLRNGGTLQCGPMVTPTPQGTSPIQLGMPPTTGTAGPTPPSGPPPKMPIPEGFIIVESIRGKQCRHGTSCPNRARWGHAHGDVLGTGLMPTHGAPPRACFAFWRSGQCSKGSACAYEHVRPNGLSR
jgi:hypothetical protein